MALKVLPATEADAPRAASIESVAYGPNPISNALFPSTTTTTTSSSNPRAAQLIDQLRADPSCCWVKVIDTDLQARGEEAMVSFAKWYIWDTPQPPAPPQEWGPGTNPEACEMFFSGMRERRNARFAGKPFVFLKLLHTDPKHQRRGAASMLLEWGAREADRLGLDSYLEASPEGKPLYEKSGFHEVDTFVADFSKWGGPEEHHTALMVRPASK